MCIKKLEPILKEIGEISFYDLLCEEHMNNFFTKNLSTIVEVCNFLNSITFIGKLAPHTVDKTITPHLYPSFSSQYQPRVTTGDGSCLWNMISLGICGSEILMKYLRLLTVVGLLLFKKDFYKLLENRFKNLDQSFPENQAKLKFEGILRIAMDTYEFGNEYHLLVLSTVLSRNIYVYSYFTRKGELMLPKCTSDIELLKHFDDRTCKSSLVGQHLRYEPLNNRIFNKNLNFQNLYGFFAASWKHYAALIPKTNVNIVYTPQLNLFVQHDDC